MSACLKETRFEFIIEVSDRSEIGLHTLAYLGRTLMWNAREAD